MDYFSVTHTDSRFHIEGFPDAVKVVGIGGPKAKRLADLALHKSDLEFASESLAGINDVSGKILLQRALWRSAIINLMKCFGDNESRFSLSAKNIYKGNILALENFQYYRSLRNKHLVHDVNSFSQCLPGAILNKKDQDNKIAKIVCFQVTQETLDDDAFSNLDLLIKGAQKWVLQQFDDLCDILTKELESIPYRKLYDMDTMTYSKPIIDEINDPRLSSGDTDKLSRE